MLTTTGLEELGTVLNRCDNLWDLDLSNNRLTSLGTYVFRPPMCARLQSSSTSSKVFAVAPTMQHTARAASHVSL
jgi:hypothetical protein